MPQFPKFPRKGISVLLVSTNSLVPICFRALYRLTALAHFQQSAEREYAVRENPTYSMRASLCGASAGLCCASDQRVRIAG